MSNGTHPAMNASQGMFSSSLNSSLIGQNTITTAQAYNNVVAQQQAQQHAQQQAYNQAITAGSGVYRDKWTAPRVHIEIDLVTNGYVLAVGNERMIAKDLEELQQHFIAQVVSKLVLDEDK